MGNFYGVLMQKFDFVEDGNVQEAFDCSAGYEAQLFKFVGAGCQFKKWEVN